jgi:hypothetical protein
MATLYAPSNSLLSFLGFTNGQTGSRLSTIQATNSYLFPFDEYISIWIENIGTSSLDLRQVTYKIPIQPRTSNTIFWTDNNFNKELVENRNRQFPLDKLNISVIDQYGNLIDNNGIDWSMSLEMSTL